MAQIATKALPQISISVVSHAQIHLIEYLLQDILHYCNVLPIELILTLNLSEVLPFEIEDFPFPIKVIRNSIPIGYGANHNQAFTYSTGQFFCVINPDIRFHGNPFITLLDCLQDSLIGVTAPLVLNPNGKIEDSARRFPTPFSILCKAFGKPKSSDYLIKGIPVFPDWVGGMFMLFPHDVFKQLGGFDQRYYLYYEDVDLCARLRLHGYEVAICPNARVIHSARRSSHHHFRYLKWHINSMTRFFCSSIFLKIVCLRLWKRLLSITGKLV